MNQEAIQRDIAHFVHRLTGETITRGDPIDTALMKIRTALKTADATIGNRDGTPSLYVHPDFFSHINATAVRVVAAEHVKINEAAIIDRAQRQHLLWLKQPLQRAD